MKSAHPTAGTTVPPSASGSPVAGAGRRSSPAFGEGRSKSASPTADRHRRHPEPRCDGRRLRGEQGSGVVAMVTLVFAFTFLGLVWLARDVDRAVSNRSAAQSIAFQSARSGAQAAYAPALRAGETTDVDSTAGQVAARRTAATLFAEYDLNGRISRLSIDGDRVTVEVVIDDPDGAVSGSGTVRAERAP